MSLNGVVLPNNIPVDPETTKREKIIEDLRGRVSRSRTALNAWLPFFGYLCLKLTPYYDDSVPTAGVAPDGSLIINPEYANGLNDPQLCGLLCHEVMHPALFCWERQQGRDAKGLAQIGVAPDGKPIYRTVSIWNVAHDHVINIAITKMVEACGVVSNIKLPDGGCCDMKYDGWSAEEVYDDILANMQPPPDGDFYIDGDGDGEGQQGDGHGRRVVPGKGTKLAGDVDAKSRSGRGKEAQQGNSSAQREIDNNWKVDVVTAARLHEREKGQGSLPGAIQKIVDEIVDPRIAWKDVLSQWVGEHGRRGDYTYHRPSRRSEAVGIYLPSMQKFGIDDVVVLWDTSGSMNGRETEILGDVGGMCEDLGIGLRIIICDAMVYADVRDIQSAEEAIPHIKGGGGSDFNPAFDILRDEGYEGVVVAFTDGMIGVPQTKPHTIKEVLWVLCKDDGDRDPTEGKWGQCLHIDKDGMGKLGS